MMQTETVASIRLRVDPTNPGQFFGCCGLLELADRLWPGAEGWFEPRSFCINAAGDGGAEPVKMNSLLAAFGRANFVAIDPNDETASPIQIESPINLRLDWWTDRRSGGDRLKIWAGRMSSTRIARALHRAIDTKWGESIFNQAMVVYDVDDATNKVEPFYFDARRAANARSLDIGFAPDPLGMTTVAYPAVELFCLVGIQRVRPTPTALRRVFQYRTWDRPLSPLGAACAAAGSLDQPLGTYQFEVAFRTDQRKHKAFRAATEITGR